MSELFRGYTAENVKTDMKNTGFIEYHPKETKEDKKFLEDIKRYKAGENILRQNLYKQLGLSQDKKDSGVNGFMQGFVNTAIIDNYAFILEMTDLENLVKLLQFIKNMGEKELLMIAESVRMGLKEVLSGFLSGKSYETGKSFGSIGRPLLRGFLGKIALKAGLKTLKNIKNTNLEEIKIKKIQGFENILNNSKSGLNDLMSKIKTRKNDIKKTEFGEIKNGILKIEKLDLLSIGTKEFNSKITKIFKSNPDIKKLDFTLLEHPEKIKAKLYEIIGQNYPVLEVSRLIEGQRILDINFFGVKYLNDNISKEFVDLFVENFKSHIDGNFSQIIAGENPGRVVRRDYKHMTFSMRSDLDISRKIFGGESDNRKMFEEIFNKINLEELEKSLRGSKKEGWLKDDIKKEKLKNILLKHFDIGLGDSIIKGKNIEEKLISFYEAEISSKNKVDLRKLGENISYNFENILKISNSIVERERKIVEKYKGQKFEVSGVKYDIVFHDDISPILLRDVRKGEDIGNVELQREIQKYIDELNSGFDFISPIRHNDKLEFVDDLENQIHNLQIKPDSILKNHKGTYTKQALENITEGKDGIRVFVDIVDMGIMNLRDFKNLAHRVHSGEITKENMSELLKAGDTATLRFKALVEKISFDYPQVKLSLGGDEISIFIPGKTQIEANAIIKSISSSLNFVNLKGRISHSFEKTPGIFDRLDSITSVNKIFEKKIEQISQNKFAEKGKIDIKSISLQGDKSMDDIKTILQEIGDKKINTSLIELMRNNSGSVNLEGMQIFLEGTNLRIKF